jgi:hypothetical protein
MAKAQNKTESQRPNKNRDLDVLSDKREKSQLTISDLIIPIAAGIILLLLTLFVFMPMIKTARESRKELKEVNEKIEHLENVQKSLEELDDTQLLNDLVIAKKVIPKVLQVADFVYYIDSLANSMELDTSDVTAGDISVGSPEENAERNLGVNSNLSYTGSYDNVLDFIDEIQDYSPYLVTLKDISLSMGGDDTWDVDFELTGYYISDRERNADFHKPFTKYTNFSDIMDIFSVKVEKLDEIE